MEPHWWLTKDGDLTCLSMYERHYSSYQYADGRIRKLFVGPGEKIVLRTCAGDAFWVWRKFRDDCIDVRTGERQAGINCAAFRNESSILSSELIRQACAIAAFCWPDRRYYTYVDENQVGSGLPGWCFIAAGWKYARQGRRRVRTKSGKLILEHTTPPAPAAGSERSE